MTGRKKRQKKPDNLQVCLDCGSMCCTYFCLEIDAPRSRNDFEDIKWYVCHKNTKVYRSDGTWHLLVENRCKNLAEDGTCTDYDNRPAICREYDPENCEGSGDFDYDLMFERPEEVEDYLRERFSGSRKRTGKVRRKRYNPPRSFEQD